MNSFVEIDAPTSTRPLGVAKPRHVTLLSGDVEAGHPPATAEVPLGPGPRISQLQGGPIALKPKVTPEPIPQPATPFIEPATVVPAPPAPSVVTASVDALPTADAPSPADSAPAVVVSQTTVEAAPTLDAALVADVPAPAPVAAIATISGPVSGIRGWRAGDHGSTIVQF